MSSSFKSCIAILGFLTSSVFLLPFEFSPVIKVDWLLPIVTNSNPLSLLLVIGFSEKVISSEITELSLYLITTLPL